MKPLFLDASFAIAAKLKRDQQHGVVADLWRRLLLASVRVVTTTFVVDEIAAFLASRGDHSAAVEMGEIMMASSHVELIHVDEQLFNLGWNYFIRHDDKRYSLTDCISFVVMEQRGLRQALTFDQHFGQAGFECLPDGSFAP